MRAVTVVMRSFLIKSQLSAEGILTPTVTGVHADPALH